MRLSAGAILDIGIGLDIRNERFISHTSGLEWAASGFRQVVEMNLNITNPNANVIRMARNERDTGSSSNK